ncbi:3-hydroxyisobutyrate dehydrogenase [Lipingzhangella halophila]|uniref:3-hydroxyisobutyrate dehydrogenase n=1 Tax=Lipingzhangella halophila TaxID=1783352 RepID=A0A7W7W1B4_9ACTN|nr:NAD(P)-dependent oxidoreductase [Lipingzhangella halophila]MBB4929579.1 3-hydroxyisobutyrate dehydrogenase [Lipingzhangella halophila]
MSQVGFIGLGTMGAPMLRNLAGSGAGTIVFDLDAACVRDLAAETGAAPARAASDFAGAEAVVTMLPTSDAVAEALFDWDGGIARHLPAGSVVIDMSSSDPTQTVRLGERLREHGVDLVDAPVSGAVAKATDATLSIMMGADSEAAAERATPIVRTMSAVVFRTGKLGTGHAMKALNNFVAGASTTAACEALIAGERFGLAPETMVQILNASTGQSFVTSNVLGEHVVNGRFASGFGLALYAKDVRIARSLTQAIAHPAPVCEAVSGALDDALDELGNVDHTRAFEYWKDQEA